MPRTPKKRSSSHSSDDDDTQSYAKPHPSLKSPKSPKAPKAVPKKWTEEDKEKLLFSVCESKGIDWDGIFAKFPDRTSSQVKDQWRQIVLPGLKKGRIFANAGK